MYLSRLSPLPHVRSRREKQEKIVKANIDWDQPTSDRPSLAAVVKDAAFGHSSLGALPLSCHIRRIAHAPRLALLGRGVSTFALMSGASQMESNDDCPVSNSIGELVERVER